MGKFSKGNVVSLISDSSVEGAVIDIIESGAETSYMVYTVKGIQTYYESQLQEKKTEDNEPQRININEFDANITAALIRNPSLSSLYSLNAAKIDFIPHQFRPVLKFIRSDRPRLLIADGVGVGKTIEAGLILREMQARQNIESVLIICPRPLITEEKWEREMKRFDEKFEALDGDKFRYCIKETDYDDEWPDKYKKAVIPYSLFDERNMLGSTSGKNKIPGLLSLETPPKFDLVIVDEAHHVRNTSTYGYHAVKQFCDNADAVVFLTATPVQLEYDDLFVMLNLLRPDLVIDKNTFYNMAEPNEFINRAVSVIRNMEADWQTEAFETLNKAFYDTEWGRMVLSHNPSAVSVLKSLKKQGITIEERVKLISDIENLHTFSNIISRTRRRDIGEFTVRKATTVTVDFTPEQKKLHDEILIFIHNILSKIHCTDNTKFMMTTIRRQIASCLFGLVPTLQEILLRHVWELHDDSECEDGFLDLGSEDEYLFKQINTILDMAKKLPEEDPKFDKLVGIIEDKQNDKKNKLMIFSSFRHTLRYLQKKLNTAGLRVGMIHGDVSDDERRELRRRFELDRNEAEALDILLFSEVGCEGLDYQFCDCMVNYDLPWNPMRIEQRIGRIDRNGQESESVSIFNMVTPGTVDYDIYDRCTSRIGVFKHSIGDCEEILGEVSADIRDIVNNFTMSDEDRRVKLQQLADNKIRFVQEQMELEEKQKDLFGIRVPENSYKKEVEEATNHWLSRDLIINLVRLYLKEKLENDKEYIVGEKSVKDLRLSQNSRSVLLDDYKRCKFPKSTENKAWEKILKSGETHIAVTFDPDYAREHNDVVLLTIAHPLVKQASRYFENNKKTITVFSVKSDKIEKGTYPFIIYQWLYSGEKEDLILKPVSTDEKLNNNILELLQDSKQYDDDIVIDNDIWRNIDSVHHSLWESELRIHKQNTDDLINYKLGSLEASHQARIKGIKNAIIKATNDKIKKMQEGHLRNAEADYQLRKENLVNAAQKADIIFSELSYGLLVVN